MWADLSSAPLSLLAQHAGAGSLLLQIGPFGKLVLLILLFFMASAIGIIYERVSFLRRVAHDSARFLEIFRRSARFSEVHRACDGLERSPLVGLFQAGSAELSYQLGGGEAREAEPNRTPTVNNIEAISRALTRASSVEVAKLERWVPFLATTASVTPFIGLLGTVVGIMNAFLQIAQSGSAGLAAVAPGIAEALINTAAGLGAAIPAVMGYNYLVTRIKRIAAEMDDFSLEFISITERSFTE